jgi:hypothetical protein
MEQGWQMAYDVHARDFGLAFLLLASLCAYVWIRGRNTSFFGRSRVGFAVNGVFVLFTSSRAFILLSNRYIKEERNQTPLAFERFLFNIGFPCLLTAYIRICYHCLGNLKDHTSTILYLIVAQCYLFIIGDTLEETVLWDQRTVTKIIHILNSCALLCGLFAIIVYVKIFYSDSSHSDSNQINDFKLLSVDTSERINCEDVVIDRNNTKASKGANTEQIITLVTLLIGISCVVMKLCIMTRLFEVSDDDFDVKKSWRSLEYATIFRIFELGNSFMLWHLTKRIKI